MIGCMMYGYLTDGDVAVITDSQAYRVLFTAPAAAEGLG